MKYKIGDKVKVRSYSDMLSTEGVYEVYNDLTDGTEFFVPDMNKLCGNVYTVKSIDNNRGVLTVEGHSWTFRDWMIEPVDDLAKMKAECAALQRQIAFLESEKNSKVEFVDFIWHGWNNSPAVKVKGENDSNFLYVAKTAKTMMHCNSGEGIFALFKKAIPKGYTIRIKDDEDMLIVELMKENE